MAKAGTITIEPERQPYELATRLMRVQRELIELRGRIGELMAEQDALTGLLSEAMEPGESRELLLWVLGDPYHLSLERDTKEGFFHSSTKLEEAESFTWPEAELAPEGGPVETIAIPDPSSDVGRAS